MIDNENVVMAGWRGVSVLELSLQPFRFVIVDEPNVTVSTILEKRAIPSDRTQGLDLADYLFDVQNSML
jgi:hypothetical protein